MFPLSNKHGIPGSLVLMVAILACREEPTAPAGTATSLEIVAESLTVLAGDNLELRAITTFEDETEEDVTAEAFWSTDPGIAGEVDPAGLFNSRSGETGVETVRAEYLGQLDTVNITVSREVRGVSIVPVSSFARAGEEITFTAIAELPDGSLEFVTDRVEWQVTPGVSGNIGADGVFRATGASGFETVTARYKGGADSSGIRLGTSLIERFDLGEIPGGTFTMGDAAGAPFEQPEHEVNLSPYYIGRHEITNADFVQFLIRGLTRRELVIQSNLIFGRQGRFPGSIYALIQGSPLYPEEFISYSPEGSFQVIPGFEEYPMVRVTWYGAAAFCDFYGLRLPTEAEWEAASRSGQQFEYGTANGTISHDLANYEGTGGRDSFDGFSPTGSFPANPFGLYDMAGNAMEYVFDIFQANYYQLSPVNDPMGPEAIVRLGVIDATEETNMVIRGGAWTRSASACRSAARAAMADRPDLAAWPPFLGFRVAKSK